MIVFIRILLALTIGLVSACSTNTETSETKVDSTRMTLRPGPNVERMLQGNWQSLSDPNDTFTINGSTRMNRYKGQPSLTLTFMYVADCGGPVCNNRKSRYGCFTTAGKFDIDCQAIVRISATDLEITQGDTGNTTRYQKKP